MNLARLVVLLLLTSMIACSGRRKSVSHPIITTALAGSEDGTVLIRSSGVGESESAAIKAAEYKAFHTLLFYGLPSSAQARPLIDSATRTVSKNEPFMLHFFEEKGYAPFIITAASNIASQKQGKYYYVSRDIKINMRSLRAYLENQNIIRRFGY